MGRGVFAGRAYRKNEVIEVCPVIRIPSHAADSLGGGLEYYAYLWGEAGDELAVALGYGSLYNHSSKPNAKFTTRIKRNEIVFRAVRDIAPGEQIFIDYQWVEPHFL
jgi:SET domain-containing protein